jgi:hypothetical protein
MNNTKINTEQKENTTEKYIIDMNKTLREENLENAKQIETLNAQISDLEDSNDNADKRNDYLKNVLKNFHELNKLHTLLSENRKNMTNNCIEKIQKGRKESRGILRSVEAIATGFLGYKFWSDGLYPNMGYLIIILGFIMYFEKMINDFRTPNLKSYKTVEKETLKKIKRITKAQDYIYEFIDNI